MAVTDTINYSLSTTSGLAGMSGSDSETGNLELNSPNLSFPANTNGAVNSNAAQFTFAFNAAAVQLLFMVATQNCTITTNNANAATNTVSLVAGIPLVWGRSAGYFAQPFNANTTVGYMTCAAATILNFRVVTT